MNVSDFTL